MKVNCREAGGPDSCQFVAEGKNPKEVIAKLTEHVKATHPEIQEQMKKMTAKEQADWTAMTTARMHL